MLRRIKTDLQWFTLLLFFALAVPYCASKTISNSSNTQTARSGDPQIPKLANPVSPVAPLRFSGIAPPDRETIGGDEHKPARSASTPDRRPSAISAIDVITGSAGPARDGPLRADGSPSRANPATLATLATLVTPTTPTTAVTPITPVTPATPVIPVTPLAPDTTPITDDHGEVDDATNAAVFVDQYLQNSLPDDAWRADNTRESYGRQIIESEIVRYQSSDNFFGDETEQGMRARWRRETLNWGDIDMQLVASDRKSDFLGDQNNGRDVVFTLRQSNLPVSENWVLNNTAGSQRTRVDSFLHGGYRIRLPTTPLIGFSSEFSDETRQVRWYAGSTGNYRGVALQQFETDGGDLMGGLYRQELTPNVTLGAEIVNIRGAEAVRDHTSLLLAGRYSDDRARVQHNLHLLADDEATFGIWGDSRQTLRKNLVLRYGAFYLQPQLAWMDRPIATDQSGFYLRTDKRSFLYNYSLGYDYTKSGLDNDLQSTSTGHSLYLNGNYRPARRLTLGVNGNLLLRQFDSAESNQQTLWRISNFASYRFAPGTMRLEVHANDTSNQLQIGNDSRYGTRLSYDWNMPRGLRLTTEVALEEQDRFGNSSSTRQASVLFRHNLAERFSWGVNTGLYRTDSKLLGSSTGISLNADGRWQFLRNWHAALSIVRSEASVNSAAVDFFGPTQDLQTDSLWLTIGYSKASGQPYPRFGRGSAARGSGRIHGEVFYDENHDSIRQPGERAVVGLVVLLDGRDETRTDSQGRYSFEPVGTGRHQVSLLIEDLPLPWGLFDEAPRDAHIRLRQTTDVDFALIRVQ